MVTVGKPKDSHAVWSASTALRAVNLPLTMLLPRSLDMRSGAYIVICDGQSAVPSGATQAVEVGQPFA